MNRATTSASNIFRRELCPGSAAAEAGLPEEDSDDSREGTMLHEMDADPSIDRSALTPEQRDVLKAATDADEEIFAVVRRSLEIPDDEPFEEGREQEFWFHQGGIKKLFPGHMDRWRHYPRFKVLVIIDKKFGRNVVVPADTNRQLRSYFVQGAQKFRQVENVLVAINQPRLRYEDSVSIAEYKRTDLPAAQQHIQKIWDISHQPNAPRIAGEEQCRNCKARLHCDAYRARYEWLSVPDGAQMFINRLASLTDEQLARVFTAIKCAELIKAKAQEEIIRRKDAGGMAMIDLQRTGSQSKITDPVKAAEILRDKLGFTAKDILRHSEISLGGLSDHIRERDSLTAVEAKRKIRDTLAEVLEITPKSPSIKLCQPSLPE